MGGVCRREDSLSQHQAVADTELLLGVLRPPVSNGCIHEYTLKAKTLSMNVHLQHVHLQQAEMDWL